MKPHPETKNGRRRKADAKPMLDTGAKRYLNARHVALDIPLTNRAFLLGVVYLAKAINHASGGTPCSVEDVRRIAEEVQDVVVSDIERAAREMG
jgi:hypothetical protein